MIPLTVQDVFESQGFVVLAYTIQAEFDAEREGGIVRGHSVEGSMPDDAVMRVIGEATVAEWVAQCIACEDPIGNTHGLAYVGYLKVVAE